MKDIKKYNVLPVGKMYYVAVTHDLAYVAVPYIKMKILAIPCAFKFYSITIMLVNYLMTN